MQAFPEAMLDYFLILTLIQGYIFANKWSLDAENKIDFVIQPKSSQAIWGTLGLGDAGVNNSASLLRFMERPTSRDHNLEVQCNGVFI